MPTVTDRLLSLEIDMKYVKDDLSNLVRSQEKRRDVAVAFLSSMAVAIIASGATLLLGGVG